MAEVCSQQQPSRKDNSISNKTFQAWKTLLYWVAFFFQVVLQILRGTLSGAKVLSCFGFGHHLLFSSDSVSGADVDLFPSTAFKLLPSEIPEAEVDVDVNKEEEGLTVMPVCPPLPLVCADGVLEKLTVVLDLDETLVCAYETSTLPAIIRSQAIEAGLKWFELECITAEREVDGKQKVNHVTVFERPHLQEFLQKLNGFADLILFTAGLEGYARPLVDKIDVEKRFSLRLYRPATVTTEYREHVKDLSCLSTNFCRTVIVDNNPFSFLLQPLNGIPCIPFYAGQPYDDQLIGVLLPLLRRLSFEMDVRPVLCEIFHMPGWFQKHGIPMSKWIPN